MVNKERKRKDRYFYSLLSAIIVFVCFLFFYCFECFWVNDFIFIIEKYVKFLKGGYFLFFGVLLWMLGYVNFLKLLIINVFIFFFYGECVGGILYEIEYDKMVL